MKLLSVPFCFVMPTLICAIPFALMDTQGDSLGTVRTDSQCINPAGTTELFRNRTNPSTELTTAPEVHRSHLSDPFSTMIKDLELDLLWNHLYDSFVAAYMQVALTADSIQQHASEFEIGKTPSDLLHWIHAHPAQTLRYTLWVGYAVSIGYPELVNGPILGALGLCGYGPKAGSITAMAQSTLARVVAKGIFAHVQSAGMGGYGVGTVNIVTRVGTMASAFTNHLMTKPGKERSRVEAGVLASSVREQSAKVS